MCSQVKIFTVTPTGNLKMRSITTGGVVWSKAGGGRLSPMYKFLRNGINGFDKPDSILLPYKNKPRMSKDKLS